VLARREYADVFAKRKTRDAVEDLERVESTRRRVGARKETTVDDLPVRISINVTHNSSRERPSRTSFLHSATCEARLASSNARP
jgi:hypothetical protein